MSDLKAVVSAIRKQSAIIANSEIKKMAERTYDLSQEYVPLDTAELKESGEIVYKKDGVIVQYTADHAVFAHEFPNSIIKKDKNPNARSGFLREGYIEAINEYFKGG